LNSIDKEKKSQKSKFLNNFLNALLFAPKAVANFFKKIYKRGYFHFLWRRVDCHNRLYLGKVRIWPARVGLEVLL
jgi:hypothetical protein